MIKFRFLLILILTASVFSCKKRVLNTKTVASINSFENEIIIDAIEVDKKEIILNQIEGTWYYKEKPFSGYAVKYYPNNSLAEKTGFSKGKREGVSKKWSESGQLRLEFNFKNNRISGDYKTWWENGVLAEESTYEKGIMQGVQKRWYSTGVMAKLRNIVDGRENGKQQAWLENGKLYVNYEAKNGRIFGLRRANSCYKLEDEKVITK